MAAGDYLTMDEWKATAEMTQFNFADADVSVAVSAASRGIDEYTGRFFYQDSSATVDRLYEWRGQSCLPIDDAVTVGTVTVDYDRDGVYETPWAQGTSFLLQPYNAALQGKPYEELQLLPLAGWYRPTWYPALVKVTGQFGWPAVPAQVKEATSILATRLLRRSREAPFGVVGLGLDNVAVRISRTDPDLAFLLDPFVKGSGALAA